MQIFLISDALTKLGAKGIHLILPYMPYTRIPDEQLIKLILILLLDCSRPLE